MGTTVDDLPREVTDVPELDLLAYGSGDRPDLGPFTAEGELVLDRMPRFLGGVRRTRTP